MPIDLSAEEFRRLGYRAVDLLTEQFAALADGPCRTAVPDAERRALVEQPVPLHGADPDAVLDDVASTILPYPMGNRLQCSLRRQFCVSSISKHSRNDSPHFP